MSKNPSRYVRVGVAKYTRKGLSHRHPHRLLRTVSTDAFEGTRKQCSKYDGVYRGSLDQLDGGSIREH